MHAYLEFCWGEGGSNYFWKVGVIALCIARGKANGQWLARGFGMCTQFFYIHCTIYSTLWDLAEKCKSNHSYKNVWTTMWKFSTPPLKILIRLKILTPLKKSQDLPRPLMRKSQFMKNFEPRENLNPSTAIKLNHPENISTPLPPEKISLPTKKIC